MKFFITLIFLFIIQSVWADNSDKLFNVQSSVVRQGDTFLIYASYQTPLNACQAYRFLTDYEAAKKVPGVIESKATRQSSDKVLVERSAEEKILFFSVKLHTLIEYTEYPIKGTEFTQIRGDSKKFSGKWSIEPHTLGSVIKYEGILEPDSTLPMFVLKYFIENNLEDRFKFMAKMSAERKTLDVACN
jgi:hypothetical protein